MRRCAVVVVGCASVLAGCAFPAMEHDLTRYPRNAFSDRLLPSFSLPTDMMEPRLGQWIKDRCPVSQTNAFRSCMEGAGFICEATVARCRFDGVIRYRFLNAPRSKTAPDGKTEWKQTDLSVVATLNPESHDVEVDYRSDYWPTERQ